MNVFSSCTADRGVHKRHQEHMVVLRHACDDSQEAHTARAPCRCFSIALMLLPQVWTTGGRGQWRLLSAEHIQYRWNPATTPTCACDLTSMGLCVCMSEATWWHGLHMCHGTTRPTAQGTREQQSTKSDFVGCLQESSMRSRWVPGC